MDLRKTSLPTRHSATAGAGRTTTTTTESKPIGERHHWGATALLIPVSARRQLNDLSDEMATKLTVLYFSDAREALIKALGEF